MNTNATKGTSMARTETDVCEVQGGVDGGLVAVYCRGEVPSGVFVRAAEHYLGGPLAYDDELKARRFTDAEVKREWWRAVPNRSGDFDHRFISAKPHARGAFQVTVIHLEEWDR